MNSFELERFVSRQLRALPAPRAPLTLLPRVLAAASRWAERPWYAREWFTWPLAWKAGSAALLLLTIAAGIAVVPAIQLFVYSTTSSLTSTVAIDVPGLASAAQVAASVVNVMWRALVQPFLPYAFVVVALMCGACATVVFALNRLVFGRALHS